MKWAWWLVGVVLLLALLRWTPMLGGGLLLVLVTYLTVKAVSQRRA